MDFRPFRIYTYTLSKRDSLKYLTSIDSGQKSTATLTRGRTPGASQLGPTGSDTTLSKYTLSLSSSRQTEPWCGLQEYRNSTNVAKWETMNWSHSVCYAVSLWRHVGRLSLSLSFLTGGPWATSLTWETVPMNKRICAMLWLYQNVDNERKKKPI